jgi:beta-galactosidase
MWLYEGVGLTDLRLAGCTEEGFWEASGKLRPAAAETTLPLQLEPGSTAWLFADWSQGADESCFIVRSEGSNAKLTVFANGILIARIWLPEGVSRPTFTGGAQQQFHLPGPFRVNGSNRLAIFIEAVEADVPAEITSFHFEPVQSIGRS